MNESYSRKILHFDGLKSSIIIEVYSYLVEILSKLLRKKGFNVLKPFRTGKIIVDILSPLLKKILDSDPFDSSK